MAAMYFMGFLFVLVKIRILNAFNLELNFEMGILNSFARIKIQ